MNHFWILIILKLFRSLNYHIDGNITFMQISLMLIGKLKMLINSFYKIHVILLLLILFHCFIKIVLNKIVCHSFIIHWPHTFLILLDITLQLSYLYRAKG